ncbi:MAG TPA: nucleotide disphospho-sugar-binding domain-containing protein [Tepidisphaeraceae bacterium]|nr:nucleotide disphospho-sugar-binding domain-containing protein [Tepidisphaeraceae bacterium]
MNVLLVPLGSHGDVHPFVGLGLALRARGHRVRVIVNPFFGPLVEQAGLEFIPLGTTDYYLRMLDNPDLWKPVKGPRAVFASLAELHRPIYEAVAAHNVPGDTVMASSILAMGARAAQDKLGIPMATIHLQPAVFRSTVNAPKLPGMLLGPWVPAWMIALQWKVIDTFAIDRAIGPSFNAFRKELGLPKVKGFFREYGHSPRRVIGMFPEWFAPSQPGWPLQTRLTGFPLYDERGLEDQAPDLRKFLDEGEPPIAFTFGSAMWHAHELLEQSARACTLLGRRGLLLTRRKEQVPPRLPPGVKHVEYAPFSELLPHCAALVHHGGIGTASQALAAGVPQLVLPHTHDQPDNAARLEKLGVGRTLSPKKYRADRVAQVLADLLGSQRVKESCAAVAKRMAGTNAMEETCELMEALLQTAAVEAAPV